MTAWLTSQADAGFQFAGMLALTGWLPLAFAPGFRFTQRIVAALAIVSLAILYIVFIVAGLGSAQGGGFGSLDEVSTLFDNRLALLAGWIHYLALDLFIGAWEVRDARRLAIPHLLVIPCLILTFLLGPAGLLLYLLLRLALRKTFHLEEC